MEFKFLCPPPPLFSTFFSHRRYQRTMSDLAVTRSPQRQLLYQKLARSVRHSAPTFWVSDYVAKIIALHFGTPCPQCRNISIRQRFGYRRSPRGPRRWKQGNRSRGASSTPYVTTIVPYSPAPRDTIGLISSPPTLLSQFPISFPPTRGKTNPFRFPAYRCSAPYIILSTTDLARL